MQFYGLLQILIACLLSSIAWASSEPVEQPQEASQFVFIGSNGNLAHRYVWPALFRIWSVQGPEYFQVVAVVRRQRDVESLKEKISQNHQCTDDDSDAGDFIATGLPAGCSRRAAQFASAVRVVVARDPDADYFDVANALGPQVGDLESTANHGTPSPLPVGNRIFYVATPPSAFASVAAGLHKHCVGPGAVPASIARSSKLVLEKPIGRDRSSAEALLGGLREQWGEGNVLLMDHFLGKRGAQMIPAARAAAGEGLRSFAWDWINLKAVDVLVTETDPLSPERADTYAELGVVRDVMQSHATQLASLVLGPLSTGSADKSRIDHPTGRKSDSKAHPTDSAAGYLKQYKKPAGVVSSVRIGDVGSASVPSDARTRVALGFEPARGAGRHKRSLVLGRHYDADECDTQGVSSSSSAGSRALNGTTCAIKGGGNGDDSGSESSRSRTPTAARASMMLHVGLQALSGSEGSSQGSLVVPPLPSPERLVQDPMLVGVPMAVVAGKGLGKRVAAVRLHTQHGGRVTFVVQGTMPVVAPVPEGVLLRAAESALRAAAGLANSDEPSLDQVLESCSQDAFSGLPAWRPEGVYASEGTSDGDGTGAAGAAAYRGTLTNAGRVRFAFEAWALEVATGTPGPGNNVTYPTAEEDVARAAAEAVRHAAMSAQLGVELVEVHGPAFIVERPVERKLQIPRPAGVPSGMRLAIGWDEPNPQVLVAVMDPSSIPGNSPGNSPGNKGAQLEGAIARLEASGSSVAAYARVLHAALTPDTADDAQLFASPLEVLAAWRAWDPVVQRAEGTGPFARAARLEAARLARLSSAAAAAAAAVPQGTTNATDVFPGSSGSESSVVDEALIEEQREEADRLAMAREVIEGLTPQQKKSFGAVAEEAEADMGDSRVTSGISLPSAHSDVDATKVLPPVRLYRPGETDWLGLDGPAMWVRCDDNQCSLDSMAVGDAAKAGMLPPMAREAALQRQELLRQGKRPLKASSGPSTVDRLYDLMEEEAKEMCVGVDGVARHCGAWMQGAMEDAARKMKMKNNKSELEKEKVGGSGGGRRQRPRSQAS